MKTLAILFPAVPGAALGDQLSSEASSSMENMASPMDEQEALSAEPISSENLAICLDKLNMARKVLIEDGIEAMNDTIHDMYKNTSGPDEPYLFARTNIPDNGKKWDEVIEMAHPVLQEGVSLGDLLGERDDLYAWYGPGTQQMELYDTVPRYFDMPGAMFLASWYYDKEQAQEQGRYSYSSKARREYIGFVEEYNYTDPTTGQMSSDYANVWCPLTG